ncbi:MAG: DPP IV N-terminal domain-containing protein [Bryobacteraceae bacterium]|nr:DPP IV N-terminal domain-containing protein [Bryobacteraceae bacterium]
MTLESLGEAMRTAPAQFAPGRVWAPQGGRFVWIEGSKVMVWSKDSTEAKELFSLEAAEKSAVALTHEKAFGWENRRVQEERLQWSADGKKILLLLRGDLFLWDSTSGKIDQLTATSAAEHDPKLSPDGTKVSFRRGFELYVLDIAPKQETRLTFDGSETRLNAMLDWVYPEELDLGTAHWWSPDSKQIAYMQFDIGREHIYGHIDHLPVEAVAEPERYPKAGTPNADVRIGVVNASGGETRWMDLGEPRLYLYPRVNWTPDSKSVAVQRLNRVQDHFEVLYADAKSGVAHQVINVSDPAWFNVRDDFRILSTGAILIGGEIDGFRHLYMQSADGKTASRLTEGAWEVTGLVCVDEAKKRVWYESSETSPLERQLYSVGFDGGGKRQLTQGAGWHSISMSPACDLYVDSYSNLENPAVTSLYDGDGKQLRVLKEANREVLDKYEILKTEIHNFKGADGTQFYGRLIKPANFDPSRKYPVIVQVYGGPGAQSIVNRWQSGLSMDQVFAHKGYIVWQMDNRGSQGRGHAFETPVYRHFGKVEVEDQKEGVKYLLSLGFADPNRIGVMGWSYGGYMTLQCLLHAPEVFKAGAAGAPVTNWLNYDTIYTERYMGLPWENPDGYRDSSPVNFASQLKGRLLLIHNIEDDNVLFANSLQMQNALQEAGKSYDLLIYPQKSHGVGGKARSHLNAQYVRFFDEALK